MTSLSNLIDRSRRRRLPDPEMRRLLRLKAGLTQAEIAAAIGVERPTVSRWEAGIRSPRGAHAEAYAELLRGLAVEVTP